MQELNETLQLEALNNVERSRYELWRHQGEVLTAHGVAIAPSHHSYKDEDGNERSYVSVWGAFHDAAELAEGEPVLMLATEVNPHNIVLPALPQGFSYSAIANQTTGVACAHKYLVGVRLEVSKTVAASIAAFSERDGHDCVGLYRHSLGELSAYNALLQSFGLSADTCWEHLAEACYPIDATDDNVRVLTNDVFPTSLMRQTAEDLSYANGSATRLAGLTTMAEPDRFDMTKPSKWALFLLTENCD
jgi:hypothetical protein